jgi:hypothetical protein
LSRLIDLTGKRFGRLVVIERAKNGENGKAQWLCKCDCGNTKIVSGTDLRKGSCKSCGCYRHDFRTLDISGKRFGYLTVIEKVSTNGGHGSLWKCVCDCGNELNVRHYSLTTGHTSSCGCYNKSGKAKVRHGQTGTRLHNIWGAMKQRCNNPNFKQWKDYGGRGIKVCDEWNSKHGFDSFYKWAMDNGYDSKLEIDRIDNDGNYEPNNCRFVTHKENMNNRTRK